MSVDISNVESTLSSWDSCMANDYCKYPVIVGIVVGSLVVLTLLFCLTRCLCCGGSCFGCCGGRKKQKGDAGGGYSGFQPGPPPPVPFTPQTQYGSPKPPIYATSPYPTPRTATFDASSPKSPAGPTHYNEDSLPAMPSWSDAKTRHVEEEPVEMERLYTANEKQQQQQEPQSHLLSGYDESSPERFSGPNYAQSNYAQSNYAQSATHHTPPGSQQGSQYGAADPAHAQAYGTNAYMPSAPYDSYGQQSQQYMPPRSPHLPRSPSATRSPGPSAFMPTSPYEESQQLHQFASQRSSSATRNLPPAGVKRTPSQSTAGQGSVLPLYSQPITPSSPSVYAPSSTVPPSYHTQAPSISRSPPPPQPPTEYGGYVPRRPVQGSWRDV